MKIAISSGHGDKVRGASAILDEVTEARRVVDRLGELIDGSVTFHENQATTQEQNLKNITNWHNAQFDGAADLHVSVHFNAYKETTSAMGTEVCYLTQDELADRIALAISNASGLINRGSKYRSDLWFLNKTNAPACLLEIAFCDSTVDAELYTQSFEKICQALAAMVPDDAIADDYVRAVGKCSWFGGPKDMGVTATESLALAYEGVNPNDKPHLFLPGAAEEPPYLGLARKLNPDENYLALRWDYQQFSKTTLAGDDVARIINPKNGKVAIAHPADWGPAAETGRACDLSPGIMSKLGLATDDSVEVVYPWHEDDDAGK